jgi:thiosulfate dehydrogenase [quinone] large subunit
MKLKASWKNQLWPLRIMRLWLGGTWIYAGWDKASDPGFLTDGSPTFIGSQLAAYAQNSPIDFLLNRMIEHATQVGIFVMLSEFAVGFATLLWIAPTWAALGGFLTSLTLWLSSTWNIQPYFLASNSVYTVFWLTYFLFLYGSRRKSNISVDRRGFIRISSIAGLTVAAVGLGRLFPKSAAAAVSATPQNIIEDSSLSIGETFNFTSKSGSPAVLFKSKTGVYAYSAVCTHEGCTVQYNSASKNLQCGCHGAVFDPESDGNALSGPTNKPLPKIKVAVEGAWIVEV